LSCRAYSGIEQYTFIPLLSIQPVANGSAASAQPTLSATQGLPRHGGLALWGSEHFAERLRDAVAWLDRYPDFKFIADIPYTFEARFVRARLSENPSATPI
jgi:hypothetical protein